VNKDRKFKLIDNLTEEIMKEGWDRNQAKSLAWAEFFEQTVEMKYGLASTKRYDCYCHDCKEGHCFGAADSIRTFILLHKDHKTRTFAI
jgi:hypothetical protein